MQFQTPFLCVLICMIHHSMYDMYLLMWLNIDKFHRLFKYDVPHDYLNTYLDRASTI